MKTAIPHEREMVDIKLIFFVGSRCNRGFEAAELEHVKNIIECL